MKCKVLGVGYPQEEYCSEQEIWERHGITFDFSDTPLQAMDKMQTDEYACIIIRTNHVDLQDLAAFRHKHFIPIVIMPSEFTVKQRQEYAVYSVIQYIHAAGLSKSEHLDSTAIRNFFEPTIPVPRPLTFVTARDVSVCIEQRSVEVCGQEVRLTPKEFDILVLLICNQRQVFTHEMIVNCVWGEDAAFYSKKLVATHISNLRRKLKTILGSEDYIESVHGVGYRFMANR